MTIESSCAKLIQEGTLEMSASKGHTEEREMELKMRADPGPRTNFLRVIILLQFRFEKHLSHLLITFLKKMVHFSASILTHFYSTMFFFSISNVHVDHLGILLKCIFCFRGLEWNPKLCISHCFSGHADTAGLWTTLWETKEALEVWSPPKPSGGSLFHQILKMKKKTKPRKHVLFFFSFCSFFA